MNSDDVLKTFVVECQQLLLEMEDALLKIEQAPDDPDIINAIFRAAHTIKGSAGLFGLEAIVSFTHVAESVLDLVRNGQLSFTEELAALFLQVCDHVGVLVDHASNGRELSEEIDRQGNLLAVQLRRYLQSGTVDNIAVETKREEWTTKYDKPPEDTVQTDHWHLSLRFGRNLSRNGMDPLSILRYLNTIGQVTGIVPITDAIPPAAEMDPESCYLGFEIGFQSDADRKTIEGVFDFVREESSIRVLPPHSGIAEYRSLLRDMPEADEYLGKMLVRCGTLTPAELESALQEPGEEELPPASALPTSTEKIIDTATKKQETGKDTKQSDSSLIRVDAGKLDHLINLIGELIIAGAGVNLLARRAGIPELAEATGDLSSLVEDVRDSALTLRMVQIGSTFNRFQRVVRDVSKELGKDIRLEISGAETELDKTVVEKIGDPLTHLVRNSMDHGIESAEVRVARGKPARGTVSLNAYHDSGSIVIEVSDDGGGLNKEKILNKAIERGLVSEGLNLSEKEIYNLIFEPGFSTADQVSNLSGRGVGMDVVKKNIQALRGTVDLENNEGQGATVRIRLPLTLAIIDGFLIGVGSASYVVPLEMVFECIELPRNSQSTAKERNYLNLRGEVLPFVRLRELFEVDDEPVARRQNIVVVKYAGKRVGLVVDQLMGEFQTVIKPLGRVFSHLKSISGFTILGGGEVALILDVPGIVRQVVEAEVRYDDAAYAETNK